MKHQLFSHRPYGDEGKVIQREEGLMHKSKKELIWENSRNYKTSRVAKYHKTRSKKGRQGPDVYI